MWDTKMPTGDDANRLWGMIAAAFTAEVTVLAQHLSWTFERTTAAMKQLVAQGFVDAAALDGMPQEAHEKDMEALLAEATSQADAATTVLRGLTSGTELYRQAEKVAVNAAIAEYDARLDCRHLPGLPEVREWW